LKFNKFKITDKLHNYTIINFLIMFCRNDDVIKYVIANCIDLNETDNFGNYPITFICRYCSNETIYYAINCNADINLVTKYSPNKCIVSCYLIGAMKNRHPIDNKLIKILFEYTNVHIYKHAKYFNLIHFIIQTECSLEILKIAHAKGIQLDINDNSDWKPIHHACRRGKYDIIDFLVKNGVDLNCKTKESYTPLSLAYKYADIKIIKYLIRNGAKSDYILNYACKYYNINKIIYTLTLVKDLESIDSNGNTPLEYLVETANKDIIKNFIFKIYEKIYNKTISHPKNIYDKFETHIFKNNNLTTMEKRECIYYFYKLILLLPLPKP